MTTNMNLWRYLRRVSQVHKLWGFMMLNMNLWIERGTNILRLLPISWHRVTRRMGNKFYVILSVFFCWGFPSSTVGTWNCMEEVLLLLLPAFFCSWIYRRCSRLLLNWLSMLKLSSRLIWYLYIYTGTLHGIHHQEKSWSGCWQLSIFLGYGNSSTFQ